MSKLIVKITLNPNDPFDGVIFNRIKDDVNKAAAMKHIVYEAIKGRGLSANLREVEPAVELTEVVPVGLSENDAIERDINQKTDRLLENF